MLKISKKLIIGTFVGSLLLSAGTAFAWTAVNKNIPVRFAQIKLIVNGKTIQTKAEPFIYNGNVYAPVATVANMLGIHQEWDNKTPAVHFEDEKYRRQKNYVPPTMGERMNEQVIVSTMIANGISVWTYHNEAIDKDMILTLSDGEKNRKLTLPHIQRDGAHTRQTVLGEGQVSISGVYVPYSFVVHEMVWDKDSVENWITLFGYDRENGKIIKKGSVKLSEYPYPNQGVHSKYERTINGVNEFIYKKEAEKYKLIGVKMYEYINGVLTQTQSLTK